MASKWITKQRQKINERMAADQGADLATDLGEDFQLLEAETDATKGAYEVITKHVPKYLHPNQAERARVAVSGKKAEKKYQNAVLGLQDPLAKASDFFDEAAPESDFGFAVKVTCNALETFGALQDKLEEDVYRDVLEPSKALLTDEFKVIAEHRKKTEDRRLQFDFRRTKNGKAKEAQKPLPYDDAAMKEAEDKMLSSKGEATDTMTALLEAQPAHLARIDQFLSAHVDFLKEALDALTAARDEVRGKMASPAGRVDYKANIAAGMGSVKSSADAKLAAVGALMGKASSVGGSASKGGGDAAAPAAVSTAAASAAEAPAAASPPVAEHTSDVAAGGKRAKAQFDFAAENDGELTFKEGDTISNIEEVDENWLEGEVSTGVRGIFPKDYVTLE